MTMTDNPTSSTTAPSPTPPPSTSMMANALNSGIGNSASGVGGGIFLAEDTTDPYSHQFHNHPSIAGQHNMAKIRRDSIAHSQGMGGVSWGSLTIGSWLRDEVLFHATLKNSRSNSMSKNATIHLHPQHHNGSSTSPPSSAHNNARRPSHLSATSPPAAHNAYLPNLEKQYCKDYSCCGLSLPGLHDLLRHYEEAHIATSPGTSIPATNPTYSLSSANAAASQQKRKSYHFNQPRQSQQHSNNGNRNSTTHPGQQHIIQQQPHHRHPHASNTVPAMSQQRMPLSPSTTMATHSNINITPTNSNQTTSNTSAAMNPGPQLHLNGNLVDAVSTNDVFLQANSNNLAPAHNPHMLRRHDNPAVLHNASISSQHNNGKISITPQHQFNAYSLNVNCSKNGQLNNKNSINFNSNGHNSNINNSNKFSKFRMTMQEALEIDIMDQDIIGSDMIGHDADDPAFMRMNHPPPHHAVTSFVDHGAVNGPRYSTMNVPSVHPTPPPSTTAGAVPPQVFNGEDDDEDDEDDEEDEDEDDDMAVSSSAGAKSKSSHHNNHRQEGYIDDPARRLYVMDHEEHKPFKCPVIGCDKTYKNQNGLKYHKLHGHQNQKLHENADGTFSIIDPESNEPYPDGMGYEKDKPYRCEVCGKRYKNLNGLKYHRGHSTH